MWLDGVTWFPGIERGWKYVTTRVRAILVMFWGFLSIYHYVAQVLVIIHYLTL